jgi:hypothetical protein
MDGPDLEAVHDAIFGQFQAVWLAGAADAGGGSPPPIEWPDSPETATPLSQGADPWCRVTARHTKRGSTSIQYGGRVESEGVVMVNIFVPAGKRGLAVAARLGKVALAAFEGQRAGDVWFSDVVPGEVGVDGAWLQLNVKAIFHYSNHL